MSRDANGAYSRVTPPGAGGYVPSTPIKSAEVNSEINDIGQEITNSIDKGGRTNPTANLPMSGFKHTGAAQAIAGGEYVEYQQWNAARQDSWVSVAESWAFFSTDAPTFVITVPTGAATRYSVGMRIRLTQTTVKYFIITAVTDTTLTVYGGTDYTLVNAAISAISVSTAKAPLGFPLEPAKWTVRLVNTADVTQLNPVANTYYNLGSITVSMPIGCWKTIYQVCPYMTSSAGQTAVNMEFALSTSATSFSYADMVGFCYQGGAASSQIQIAPAYRSKAITVASKTAHYLVARTTTTGVAGINFAGNFSNTLVEFVCAYL